MNGDDIVEVEVGGHFTVLPIHLALLKASWWRWEEVETGAPAMDGKRPYGNSDVAEDVRDLLGPDHGDADEFSEEALMVFHGEMLTVMQIVAYCAAVDVGVYRRLECPLGANYMTVWERV